MAASGPPLHAPLRAPLYPRRPSSRRSSSYLGCARERIARSTDTEITKLSQQAHREIESDAGNELIIRSYIIVFTIYMSMMLYIMNGW
jgi:hypothetical protein